LIFCVRVSPLVLTDWELARHVTSSSVNVFWLVSFVTLGFSM